MTNTLSPTESQIQMSFCDYVAKVRPDLRDAIIKIKNEGKLSWQKGKQNKKEGLCKGAFDLFIAIPNPKYELHGMWMEFKTLKGRVSPEQIKFAREQQARGYWCAIVRTVDQAIIEFEAYIKDWIEGGAIRTETHHQ